MARIKATLVLREFWKFPSGVEQRNLGLDWITKNIEFPSVFYHADDDNTYDVRIFEEVRKKNYVKFNLLPDMLFQFSCKYRYNVKNMDGWGYNYLTE